MCLLWLFITTRPPQEQKKHQIEHKAHPTHTHTLTQHPAHTLTQTEQRARDIERERGEIHIHIYICTSPHIHIIHIYRCIYIYLHTYILYISTGVCVYIYMYVYTYISIYLHIYIYLSTDTKQRKGAPRNCFPCRSTSKGSSPRSPRERAGFMDVLRKPSSSLSHGWLSKPNFDNNPHEKIFNLLEFASQAREFVENTPAGIP